MIRTVLFDLDGTLLDRDTSVQQFVAAQYQRFVAQLSHIPQHDYMMRWIELDCRGHIWKDKVYQDLVAEFHIVGLSWQEMLRDYENQFMFHCVAFPGLIDMLSALKQQGYSLGIITNGLGIFQSRAIQGLGIQDFFDAILISEVEGVRKPQLEIFHRALHRLSTTAAEAVFIGDHPDADVSGAKGAGLKAVWKRNPFWAAPKESDAIIDELAELPNIVQRL